MKKLEFLHRAIDTHSDTRTPRIFDNPMTLEAGDSLKIFYAHHELTLTVPTPGQYSIDGVPLKILLNGELVWELNHHD